YPLSKQLSILADICFYFHMQTWSASLFQVRRALALLPSQRSLLSTMAESKRPKAAAESTGPIATAITSKVTDALKPTHLRLLNDSHKHAGHYARDGSAASEAGETHFRLEVTSEAFAGLPLIKRHQLIYGLLGDEFKAGLHALSMTTKTPAEAPTEK
ncbi:hypothetical protein Agub_g1645, partial [Astrephomene gubernaculifera]